MCLWTSIVTRAVSFSLSTNCKSPLMASENLSSIAICSKSTVHHFLYSQSAVSYNKPVSSSSSSNLSFLLCSVPSHSQQSTGSGWLQSLPVHTDNHRQVWVQKWHEVVTCPGQTRIHFSLLARCFLRSTRHSLSNSFSDNLMQSSTSHIQTWNIRTPKVVAK